MDENKKPVEADSRSDGSQDAGTLSRRHLLVGGAAAGVAVGIGGVPGLASSAQAQPSAAAPVRVGVASSAPGSGQSLALVNGKIHTMDGSGRVVSHVLIRNGRFAEVGGGLAAQGGDVKVINLQGRTVLPGLVDAHTHIVLVGNRPGHHVLLEDLFAIDDVIERYQQRAADVPEGEFITTIGPVAAQQFPEQRLPNLTELDAVNRPVYIQAAQGGVRTNTLGKAWLNARGVTNISADGVVGGGATGSTLALQLLRQQQLDDDLRKQNSLEALRYYTTLGLTTHLDQGAFQSDTPSGGIANENNYTMYNSFLALNRAKQMPARLRVNFLHQDPATPPVTLPSLGPRLKNSFPFFGDDWLRTGGIGEFTGGGVDGLVAIASAGWRAEDHSLNLSSFQTLVQQREACNAQVPISGLRWVIAHVPQTSEEYVNRFKALGGGLVVGWGPTRTGTRVGPAYRTLFDNGINLGYHADGGDITVINPWLNFYTMITARNLQVIQGQDVRGALINEGQTLTRQETIYLATRANKWFIHEDDIGSIEVGNHADLVVLNHDFFTVPDEDILRTRSILTVVGGNVVHNAGVL